jgi:TolA-binding protein
MLRMVGSIHKNGCAANPNIPNAVEKPRRSRRRGCHANASDTEATLAVQQRLSTVQSRIERLEGQLQSLRGQIAYSTITVDLEEAIPEQESEQWYDVGVFGAFVSSVGGVVTALRALVVALAYLGPYLLVFGLPLSVVGYAAYRRRGEG